MYKSFYKLQRNAFEITPDPSFLFATQRHSDALSSLYYGVHSRKGFIVLTGEVGTGRHSCFGVYFNYLKKTKMWLTRTCSTVSCPPLTSYSTFSVILAFLRRARAKGSFFSSFLNSWLIGA